MDKRYQVFVSSTYEDLQEERKTVTQILLRMDCIPAGMELFPASNEDQWSLIKDVIDDCDYYVLILGGRYGSTNNDGMGYTEMEYRYAMEIGKPIISFVHKNMGDIPLSKTEQSPEGQEKLRAFMELAKQKMINYWSNPDDLASSVVLSIQKLIKKFPTSGWVKAVNVINEDIYKQIISLQKENEDLKRKLDINRIQAPEGVEELAQGEDVIKIDLKFEGRTKASYYNNSVPYQVTWNEIFTALSPYMTNECSEEDMQLIISAHIFSRERESLEEYKKQNKYIKLSNYSISLREFQEVKIQLKALGLIKQSTKNHSVSDENNYWTLTEHGDYIMTKLVARRK